MSKRFLPILLVLTGASLFIAFKSQGRTEGNDDNPKSKYSKVLRNVGLLLEEGHYSPKKIDDEFSKTVFNKFVKDLDDDKDVFLKSDVEGLKKYETKIDDEIHGSTLESFYAIDDIYLKRLNETSLLFKDLLDKPFDFTKNETVVLDPEKIDYPKNDAEKKEGWRKRLKYIVLSKYVDLQDEREKNKGKADYKMKADTTLEREARDQVRKQMDRYFTTKKNRETADENFTTFVNAITNSMDPHTDYLPPVDLRSFNESMSGTFFGIGAQLKEDDGKIKISTLVTGGAAWKNGDLKENDEIIKIAQGAGEPVDVTGFDVQDAVKLIRGAEKGSEVRLTVRKPDGTIKVISLLRDKVTLEDTFAKSAIINGEHKIGYIYLPEFYVDFDNPDGAKCSEDVANEIKKLKAENVDGIILDLRNNGGGSLPEVVKMAGLFIEDGPICQVKSRDEKPYQWRDKDKSVLYSGPLTVMVNELSASASEIFAAAIQDYKRGIIVGSTSTYGKGTVQRNIPLNPQAENSLFPKKNEDDLGSVKLTLQKFYRINGGATQLKGVTPDVILPDSYENLKFREKDNPSALPWDEIAKSDYTPWASTISNSAAVSKTYTQINTNSSFPKIKTDLDWIEKNTDKSYSLNIDKFKADRNSVKATYKEIDSLYKLPKALDVQNNAADLPNINAAKDKTEKNSKWIKGVGSDIYIDETIKVMNNMISQGSTAKSN